MPQILIVGFKDNLHRASGVLDELRVLDEKWILDMADAVAVHRDLDGLVAMDQSYQPTGRRAGEWGGALGVLIGASLSIPHLKGGAASVAAGVVIAAGLARVGLAGVNVSFWEDALGIPKGFLGKAEQLVLPGDSAIYVVLESLDPEPVSVRFQRFGGSILHLALNAEQQTRIERLLTDGGSSHFH